jgi:predicted DNA-binding protein
MSYDTRVEVRFPRKTHDALKRLVETSDKTLSEHVRTAIEQYLRAQRQEAVFLKQLGKAPF